MKLIFFYTLNNSLVTPIIMLNKSIYLIINILMFLLFISSIINYKYLDKKGYILCIILSLLEILYNISFFKLESSLLMFVIKIFEFILSININEEVYLNKKSAKLLTPFILWEFYLALISTIILFLNS